MYVFSENFDENLALGSFGGFCFCVSHNFCILICNRLMLLQTAMRVYGCSGIFSTDCIYALTEKHTFYNMCFQVSTYKIPQPEFLRRFF